MATSDEAQELVVDVGVAALHGSLWMPEVPARSLILMIPGSGPATRDNDTYFPKVRPHLLKAGHAIAAFDKRGSGTSTGSFDDTTIANQTNDAECCITALRGITALRDLAPELPLGVFGHSQGGWIVYELAARQLDITFAISNSGPAVGPAPQERARRVHAVESDRQAAFGDVFDEIIGAAQRNAPLSEVIAVVEAAPELQDHLDEFLSVDEARWTLERSFMRYEPAAVLAQVHVPTLAIHGSSDTVIPVDLSLDELNRIANPNIEAALLAGGDHRLLDDNGVLIDSYVPTLNRFIDSFVLHGEAGKR